MRLTRALGAIIGLLFAGHGLQKLFGWFGGPGPDATGQFFESLGLRPGKQHALAAGASETGGGLLLATGLLPPVSEALLTGVMITAIRKVHGSKGVWVSDGGFEYNLVLIGAVAALTEERAGLPWALAGLAAGAVGSTLAIEAGSRANGAAAEPAPAATAA